MDTNSAPDDDHILRNFHPWFRLYKDGHVQRLVGEEKVSAGIDFVVGVQSKDIIINHETGLSARMFLAMTAGAADKLPLLIYIHGGGSCVGSAFHPFYPGHLDTIAAEANAVVLSVNYRLAPEHPLPIAYDDTWEAIKWAAAHLYGDGSEPWLNDHADFRRVYFAGDSAGENIAHNMAMKVGLDSPNGLNLAGIVLIHSYVGNDRKSELIELLYPTMAGPDEPKINPAKDPNLQRLGCRRVLVMVAGNDSLVNRGRAYYEALKNSGWEGEVNMVEAGGETREFHLYDPEKEKARSLVRQFGSFIAQKYCFRSCI
ncbi:probable carboxylesterase 13 [Prosopis cineraria]|uniref:probable carboxylesterase 13 n=1 Tax=Prosopis cineraria TaxID=364024 RepID=UPI00240F2EF0|nr:probable carboxylesterase 13 [Prosopis cineraria]